MISNPKDGWCNFKLGEFKATPSYLTNVPVDLLTCFIEYFKKGTSSSFFDEEGSEFTFVLSNYNIFIIKEYENCNTQLFTFEKIKIKSLAKELINDIHDNLIDWCKWIEIDNFDIKQEEMLKNLIFELKLFL